jgi:hypothetical protein
MNASAHLIATYLTLARTKSQPRLPSTSTTTIPPAARHLSTMDLSFMQDIDFVAAWDDPLDLGQFGPTPANEQSNSSNSNNNRQLTVMTKK